MQSDVGSFFQDNILGWLFFGQPYTGVGVIDIAFVAILFLIFLKFFKGAKVNFPSVQDTVKNKVPEQPQENSDKGYHDGAPFSIRREADDEHFGGKEEIKKRASSAWDSLRSTPARLQETEASDRRSDPSIVVPQHFDTADFLEGAKVLYSRLQYSWAARDIADLTPFTTPEMLETLNAQAEKDPTPTTIEVLLVNANLAGVTRNGNEEKAKVLFSALIQGKGEQAPFDVKELWHFTHNYVENTTWRLDAIEPVQ